VPASTRAGRPPNIDATALPSIGGHPIRDVVADDAFVEHLGNAGRLRTIDNRPTNSFDRQPAPGSVKRVHVLTPGPHTGNAGSVFVAPTFRVSAGVSFALRAEFARP
jgi:hypothetical protein